ncbi:MAG: cation tolerance protein CutA [Candidatus Aminicenantes bacterium RBG_13_59_9]|jgi:periplasmic divalent cation tolerance protein|nr:MAG: cation tolerance protein CutA [Candidatus Aminicenantes bacterium RBG_13_59_9]
MTGFMLVLTTVPDERTGHELGRALVEERLAACVTVSPAARSFYRWEGKLCDEAEHVLFIKTRASLYDKLESRIKALHPYHVPEVIALAVEKGSRDYLDWMDEETKG